MVTECRKLRARLADTLVNLQRGWKKFSDENRVSNFNIVQYIYLYTEPCR